MKKMMMIPVLLLTALFTVRAAGDPEISAAVRAGFEREFIGATQVQWSVQGELYKASFTLGNSRLDAYFTAEGELQGSIRSLFFSQLPLPVMAAAEKKFGSQGVLDVFEINNASGTTYRLTLLSKGKKYRVKLDPQGNQLERERLRA